MGSPTIVDLWRQYVRTRSSDSWDDLLSALRPVFAKIAFRVSKNSGIQDSSEYEDVLQDILLRFTERRDNLILHLVSRPDKQIEPYLRVFAINCAHDYWRTQRSWNTMRADGPEGLDELEGQDADTERAVLLAELERLLPPDRKYRLIYRLYREGFTASDIACIKTVKLTVKGVESLIHRLKLHLRSAIKVKGT